ncbi:MFS transporter [Phenylobacterium sp. J367]|uniref:MFS transporter n=1 Tax=Phenylobacterium sp. J367 TaxID=2898435 RepID=UPI002150E207|nr:MFS transporter [Phenylobacterium sp. J367]MCR5879710.1 MFS transporter [Phenylobacterium sp. J367]
MTTATAGRTARGNVRFLILGLIFFITVINYADRAIISIAGPALSDELKLSPVTMGYIFSAFGWSYVIGQLPGGWILDRFGSKWVYAASITLWSTFTLLQGTVGFLTGGAAVALLFALRFAVGLAESPSFPANARIVAAWFPTNERGFASAVFNSAQYFSTVIFAPFMAWIVHEFGWRNVFWVMGAIGIAVALLWINMIHPPRRHPLMKQPEIDYLVEGGALVDMDEKKADDAKAGPSWGAIKQLLSTRMLIGVYVAQYCITAMTYFFLTWFPVYLVKERGLSILQAGFAATLPALCGFFGGILGGIISDGILRRTGSLTLARKIPIVGGMLLSTAIIGCNYVDAPAAVIGLMTLAFFGKGIGSLGWAVVADTSPKEIPGLNAGLFNTFGNVAGITTPIAIGYIVEASGGSFTGALAFVALNALVALVSYLFVVGEIRRVTLNRT